ncbi:carbonic anhydrase-related protein 10-like isoform X2 [Gigantopelta aegis]|uniref:carbonic anhydrase-related protein 10-like isoform X2 n=1 Tax=Gigantopelta aegis TaxID=1735272 RepID=UPI001B88AEC4|nr:carbonic anhydrase-related protein 10-like isoform X2 [Gigantopelta aegis]
MDLLWIRLGVCSIVLHLSGGSGPGFWGLLNPDWSLCSKGKNQSPINIEPASLLFDPSLDAIMIDGTMVSGMLENNGHDITFTVSNRSRSVNLTGGPLSYRYRVAQIRLHFSTDDHQGSEHTIDGKSFSLEFHIVAYNADLYTNLSYASRSPRGIATLAVFAQVSDTGHSEFGKLTFAMNRTKYKGDKQRINFLRLTKFLPATSQYVTYDGSLTYPGCFETVTWIVLNKPIYISKEQLDVLRNLNQAGRENPQMQWMSNLRPQQDVNQRTVRTNINFVCPACQLKRVGHMIQASSPNAGRCSMGKNMFYQVNSKFKYT